MYLVMGDNCDNSVDLWVIGLVFCSELLGKVKRVFVLFDYDDYYLFWKEWVLYDLYLVF